MFFFFAAPMPPRQAKPSQTKPSTHAQQQGELVGAGKIYIYIYMWVIASYDNRRSTHRWLFMNDKREVEGTLLLVCTRKQDTAEKNKMAWREVRLYTLHDKWITYYYVAVVVRRLRRTTTIIPLQRKQRGADTTYVLRRSPWRGHHHHYFASAADRWLLKSPNGSWLIICHQIYYHGWPGVFLSLHNQPPGGSPGPGRYTAAVPTTQRNKTGIISSSSQTWSTPPQKKHAYQVCVYRFEAQEKRGLYIYTYIQTVQQCVGQ